MSVSKIIVFNKQGEVMYVSGKVNEKELSQIWDTVAHRLNEENIDSNVLRFTDELNEYIVKIESDIVGVMVYNMKELVGTA